MEPWLREPLELLLLRSSIPETPGKSLDSVSVVGLESFTLLKGRDVA
jgi:hypothetical protein